MVKIWITGVLMLAMCVLPRPATPEEVKPLNFDQSIAGQNVEGLVREARVRSQGLGKISYGAGPFPAGVACYGSLDGFSSGPGVFLEDSSDFIMTTAEWKGEKGVFVINRDGGLFQEFIPAPPKDGFASYFYELPVPFRDCGKTTYVTYNYISSLKGPIVMYGCISAKDEKYTKIDLGKLTPTSEAAAAMNTDLAFRLASTYDDYINYNRRAKHDGYPLRTPQEYLDQMAKCDQVQDDAVQKALAHAQARFRSAP